MDTLPTQKEIEKRIVATTSRLYVYTVLVFRKIIARYHNGLNKRTSFFLGLFGFFVLIFLIFVARPPDDFPVGAVVTVQDDQPLSAVALQLKEQHVVRSDFWLRAVVTLYGGERGVFAGDYYLKRPRNIFQIAHTITTGKYDLDPVRIVIPEGATVDDMAIIYSKRLARFDKEKFLALAQDAEGYLFPDTYFFLPTTKEDTVFTVMRDTFNTRIAEFGAVMLDHNRTLEEIVIMASIIEKEASRPRDQRLISGLLWNRLDAGMKLQVDATFTYTHDKGTFEITRSELLDEDNLYNTYVHEGLPPGPIANPGYNALQAALEPIDNPYVFYLADHSGTTHYSKTYEEHLQKKALYID